MKTKKSSSHLADQFNVRFPEGMRRKIEEAAKSNDNSMNSEIVSRVERSFDGLVVSDDLLVAIGVMAMAMKQLAASIDPEALPEEKRKFVALLEQAATQVFDKLPKGKAQSEE